MNAAYKQEKKKAKRKQNNMTSTFKLSDPIFGVEESPSPQKKKQSLYLSFPVGAVLSAEQSGSERVKTELAFHLAESDVHWGVCWGFWERAG